MGCDIHPFLEIKVEDVWHYYAEIYLARDYELFGKLTGVVRRENPNPIAPVRGLPADASEVTKITAESWGRDGHTHSWISAEEMQKLDEWHAARGFDRPYHWQHDAMDVLKDRLTRIAALAAGEEPQAKNKILALCEEALAVEKKMVPNDSLFDRDHRENVYLFGDTISGWWRYPKERPKFIEDIRLVYWFDN